MSLCSYSLKHDAFIQTNHYAVTNSTEKKNIQIPIVDIIYHKLNTEHNLGNKYKALELVKHK